MITQKYKSTRFSFHGYDLDIHNTFSDDNCFTSISIPITLMIFSWK